MPDQKRLHALVQSFDWDTWNQRVHGVVDRGFRVVALDQAKRAADEFDLEFDADDPFVERHFTAYIGERITQLDQTTRERVIEAMRDAIDAGEADSVTALATRIADAVAGSEAFSPARALTIARTETAIAYNTGALLSYEQSGVERVEVSDGDDDEACAEADGAIWTVEEAMANPTEHPNCTRAFAPVVDDDEATEE